MGNKRRPTVSAADAQVGNVVGIDPHKRTLSAAVVDQRGGILGCRHFPVSGDGHRDLEAWVLSLGPVLRWGIEGASAFGRHTAVYLLGRDQDVRDVCPNRTAERARNRRQGKSDTLDLSVLRVSCWPIQTCLSPSSAASKPPGPTRWWSCSACGTRQGAHC